jgi:hypothetical protein
MHQDLERARASLTASRTLGVRADDGTPIQFSIAHLVVGVLNTV